MSPRKKIDYASLYSYDPKSDMYYAYRTVNGKKRKIRAKDPALLHEKVIAAENESPPVVFFRQVADEWHDLKWPTIQLKTQACYEASFNRAIDTFGNMPITEITPSDVSRIIERMAAQGYSAKTVKTQKGVMRMIFSYAIIHDPPYITSNPADYITIPRGLPKTKRSAPDDDIMQRIIDNVNKAYFGLYAYLLLYTGCRRGEALALRWDDIDFEKKTISITKELIYPSGMPVLKTTKTDAGIRTVPLLPGLEAVLKQRQSKKPSDLIFPAPDGRPLQENAFRRRWHHYCKDAGLVTDIVEIRERADGTKYKYHRFEPVITPHQLRHGYATVLHEAEVDVKTAQSFLGHADIHTTLQVYTDIRESHRSAQVNKLSTYMEKYDRQGVSQGVTKTATR